MSAVVSFREVMEANTADSIEATASQIEAALGFSKLQRQVLHAVIVDQVRSWWRRETLVVEYAAGGTRVDPAADRADFLAARFKGRDKYVTWGEATVDDHLAYIDMLTKLRQGIEATVQRHANAVAAITDAGVTCLNDLTVEVAA